MLALSRANGIPRLLLIALLAISGWGCSLGDIFGHDKDNIPAASASQKRAREIMGSKSMFGVEEAMRYFGVKPTELQLTALSEIPFTEGTLEECKDSHILVAIFPLSILDIRDRVERWLFVSSYEWYSEKIFAKDRGEIGWQLVRKTMVPNSTWKTWDEQLTLLGENEEAPTARVMVYAVIGHYLAANEMLFGDAVEYDHQSYAVSVRCSDVLSNCQHVLIGAFSPGFGLVISSNHDGYRFWYIGLASARKVDREPQTSRPSAG